MAGFGETWVGQVMGGPRVLAGGQAGEPCI